MNALNNSTSNMNAETISVTFARKAWHCDKKVYNGYATVTLDTGTTDLYEAHKFAVAHGADPYACIRYTW